MKIWRWWQFLLVGCGLAAVVVALAIYQLAQLRAIAEEYAVTALRDDRRNIQAAAELKQHIAQSIFGLRVLDILYQSRTALTPAFSSRFGYWANDLETVQQNVLTGELRYLILLQNSDELRATGGFMGSYIEVWLSDGSLKKFELQDIYEADGHLKEGLESPSGQKEYLSGDKGLRLPDANWNPDFPQSAETVMRLYKDAGFPEIDGVVAINLTAVSELIRLTGDLYLPDYRATITPDNITQVARADRGVFFPGSKQKRNFLIAMITQLRLKLEDMSPKELQHVAVAMWQRAQVRDVQMFMKESELEQLVKALHLDGQIGLAKLNQNQTAYFFAVESNVGVNKVNPYVERQVDVKVEDRTLTAKIEWQHHLSKEMWDGMSASAAAALVTKKNPPDYINYQRLYLRPDDRVNKIEVGGRPLPTWDDTTITTSTGEQLRQIGFLVPIPFGQNETATITIDLSPNLPSPTKLFIQKQSGLAPTAYTAEINRAQHSFQLSLDQLLR